MARIERFEDIEGWRLARRATNLIYDLTVTEPFCKDYALVNQIRRACISVMSNIAEGFERGGNKEFLSFLAIAKGSCGEVRSQLYIALDRHYVDEAGFNSLAAILVETSKTISGLMKYLQGAKERGSRFK
jgi:four helix bundle protein